MALVQKLRIVVLISIAMVAILVLKGNNTIYDKSELPSDLVVDQSHNSLASIDQDEQPISVEQPTSDEQDESNDADADDERGLSLNVYDNMNDRQKLVEDKIKHHEYYTHRTNLTVPDLVRFNMDDPAMAREHSSGEANGDLQAGLVPSIVHFVWCGERWFEFKHYQAILSTIRSLRPDKIIFYYEALPVMDRLFYNQWLEYLQHDYPYLYVSPLSERELGVCTSGSRTEKLDSLIKLISTEGGLYISESTWLLHYEVTRRKLDLDWALDPDTLDGYIMMRSGLIGDKKHNLEEFLLSTVKNDSSTLGQEPFEADGPEKLSTDSRIRARRSLCASVQHLTLDDHAPDCLHIRGQNMTTIYPMQIWERDDNFGRIARKIFYGTEKILHPEPSYDELVPNIGHMIWIGGGNVDFVFYLSVLSMLYVTKVEILFIHGDKEPTGPNWHEIKTTQPRVKFITRPEPTMVYQSPIQPWYRALMSDIIRVDLMIKYGGIYCDTDAIWVKPITYEDRGYDATATFDWIDWSYPYPDSVNFGISYGKRNAPFWRIFRDTMRVLHNKTPGFTGVMNPYKILERRPELLRIDRRLAVICYQMKCHPLWVSDYHNETNNHVTTNSISDWRNDVNAFHWTHPNPPEYANRETLLNSTGLFAELGKYVLEKAGLYKP